MSYKLVIAEKPSVAQSIAKVIGADKREDGYLEGNNKDKSVALQITGFFYFKKSIPTILQVYSFGNDEIHITPQNDICKEKQNRFR